MPEHPALHRCPVCGEEMEVVRLHCRYCDTTIEGRFSAGRLGVLTPEQQDFVALFLKSRGNIREMERELGVSYPTVRSRLEAIIEALGYAVETKPPDPSEVRRREILEALDRGDLKPEEAVRLLRDL